MVLSAGGLREPVYFVALLKAASLPRCLEFWSISQSFWLNDAVAVDICWESWGILEEKSTSPEDIEVTSLTPRLEDLHSRPASVSTLGQSFMPKLSSLDAWTVHNRRRIITKHLDYAVYEDISVNTKNIEADWHLGQLGEGSVA